MKIGDSVIIIPSSRIDDRWFIRFHNTRGKIAEVIELDRNFNRISSSSRAWLLITTDIGQEWFHESELIKLCRQ